MATTEEEGLNESTRLILPDQITQIRTATSTKPAFHPLGFAVPMKLFATTIATAQPTTFGHVSISTPDWFGTYCEALPFPNRIMCMAGANQSVSNLVQNRVQDFFVTVPFHEVDRKFDGAPVVNTEAQRLLSPVEGKGPIVEVVGGH